MSDDGNNADGGENLDALAQEAQTLDAAPEQAAAAEQQQQAFVLVQNNAAELLATLMMARGLALPILPKRKAAQLADVWTDEVLGQASEAGAAVLALHGQSMGNMLGKYAPYIVLIGVLARPVLETREILTTPEPKTAEVVPANG
jgi:hypothetical protein